MTVKNDSAHRNAIQAEGCSIVSSAVVYGLEESVRRAKFPMSVDTDKLNCDLTEGISSLAYSKNGTGHDQWLTGVIVQMDLCFTNKVWVEAERYHFLDFVSSQSTMHRITKFDIDHSYICYVDDRIIGVMKEKISEYNSLINCNGAPPSMIQKKYLEILYSNPSGFKLTAGITTNYRQLKTIYAQRKNHKLPEWRIFCKWIETLPESHLITGSRKEESGEPN